MGVDGDPIQNLVLPPVPEIRWRCGRAVDHAGPERGVGLRLGDALWVGAESVLGPVEDLLSVRHPDLEPPKILHGSYRSLLGAMGPEPLRDADRGNVESSIPALGGDLHHPLAADQADGLLPALHQIGQQHDVEFDRSVFEHPATSPLEGADGHRVGHLALGAEDAAEVVFDPDPPVGPFSPAPL